MKRYIITAMAALSLTMTVQAWDVQITSLPFTITAPGHYKLTAQAAANYHPDGFTPAITINDPGATAATVLDLNGLTVDGQFSGQGSDPGPGQDFTGIKIVGGVNSVTVRNGVLENFVGTCIQVGELEGTPPVSSSTIKGITFSRFDFGVVNFQVFGSVVKECVFISENEAIYDKFSPGDEKFVDNTIVPSPNGNPDSPIALVAPNGPYLLDYQSTPLNQSPLAAVSPIIAAAQSKNIQITSLPFIIASPGEYTLTPQALVSYHPDGTTPAITINDPGATTPTTLDLNGLVLDYGNLGGGTFTTAVIKIFGA